MEAFPYVDPSFLVGESPNLVEQVRNTPVVVEEVERERMRGHQQSIPRGKEVELLDLVGDRGWLGRLNSSVGE